MKMHTTPLPLFPSQILSGENQSNFVLGIARSHVDPPPPLLVVNGVGWEYEIKHNKGAQFAVAFFK